MNMIMNELLVYNITVQSGDEINLGASLVTFQWQRK
jgi:hypothetical protein